MIRSTPTLTPQGAAANSANFSNYVPCSLYSVHLPQTARSLLLQLNTCEPTCVPWRKTKKCLDANRIRRMPCNGYIQLPSYRTYSYVSLRWNGSARPPAGAIAGAQGRLLAAAWIGIISTPRQNPMVETCWNHQPHSCPKSLMLTFWKDFIDRPNWSTPKKYIYSKEV